MRLAKKYGIPESAITAMVRDGKIPWGVVRQEAFVSFYKAKVDEGIEKYEAVKLTAEAFNVSKTYIYRLIQQLS